MLAGRAEELAERVGALEDQVGVVLPGDRDAAVQLHGLAGDLCERVGAVGLRDVGELARRRRRASRRRTTPPTTPSGDISASTSMSAIRCLSAWNEPIGRPNCTRSLRVGDRHVEGAGGAARTARAATADGADLLGAGAGGGAVADPGRSCRGRTMVARRIVWSIVGVQVALGAGRPRTGRRRSTSTTIVARSPSSTGGVARPTNAATSPAAIRGSSRALASSSAPASSASEVTSERQQGRGGERAADLLEHDERLEEREAGPVVLLRDAQRGHADLLAERAPERFVVRRDGGRRRACRAASARSPRAPAAPR